MLVEATKAGIFGPPFSCSWPHVSLKTGNGSLLETRGLL